MKNTRFPLLLAAVLALALLLRLHGISWDGGYLFHPDERRIIMVADDLSLPWPPNWRLLLSPASPWNPRFFSYGSLPIYLLRVCADLAGRLWPPLTTLDSSYLVGRVLSALFDVGTVYLIYKLSRALYDETTGLLAALLVAITVLHIQLSHFYAVDTLLTFFVVLTVSFAVRMGQGVKRPLSVPLGIAWGLALATKVSAAALAAPVLVACVLRALRETTVDREGGEPLGGRRLSWTGPLLGLVQIGTVAVLTFVLLEPYAVIDVITFVQDVLSEGYMARGLADIPYTRQYIGTMPYLYPLKQMVVWSMGLPLGLVGWLGCLGALVATVLITFRVKWARAAGVTVALSWVVIYFALVGSFHAKFVRYMLPIIPFLCLWAAWGLVALARQAGAASTWRRGLGPVALVAILGGSALYTMSFMHIYRVEHPWLRASAWICANVP